MGKKAFIIGLLLLQILGLGNIPAWAAAARPTITIDGQPRSFQPAPFIHSGRTMVPVRFVIEDPALQGRVEWNDRQRTVTLTCRGKTITFVIGSLQATVDGRVHNFDVAPMIYQDRTYVPLRFLVETLGAVVSWDAVAQVAAIRFDYRPEVFAYYYYTPWDEFTNNAGLFTDVALRWFAANSQGDLKYDYQDSYAKVMKYCKDHGVRTHAGVALMGSEPLHALLTQTECRQRLINSIVKTVAAEGYDGVNIDFELMAPGDKAVFTSFLRELKNALGPQKDLSVAVFARTGIETWPVAYDYDAIGEIADRVIVMAYDYSYKDSGPGPIAPLWWVQDVADYMLKHIPREKILMGMPTYGYDWDSDGAAVTVTAPKLTLIQQRYKTAAGFDYKHMSPYYTYWDENGDHHEIWMENETSLDEKWNVVVNNRLGGLSFWRIGNGFNDLYQVLNTHL